MKKFLIPLLMFSCNENTLKSDKTASLPEPRSKVFGSWDQVPKEAKILSARWKGEYVYETMTRPTGTISLQVEVHPLNPIKQNTFKIILDHCNYPAKTLKYSTEWVDIPPSITQQISGNIPSSLINGAYDNIFEIPCDEILNFQNHTGSLIGFCTETSHATNVSANDADTLAHYQVSWRHLHQHGSIYFYPLDNGRTWYEQFPCQGNQYAFPTLILKQELKKILPPTPDTTNLITHFEITTE